MINVQGGIENIAGGGKLIVDAYSEITVENALMVNTIENGGVIIRVPASDINIYKRDVQGVIIMRIEEGNQLMGVQRVAASEETE